MLAAHGPLNPVSTTQTPTFSTLTHHMLGAPPASWKTFNVVDDKSYAEQEGTAATWNDHTINESSVLDLIEKSLAEQNRVNIRPSERFPDSYRIVIFTSRLTKSQLQTPRTSFLSRALDKLLTSKGIIVEEEHTLGLEPLPAHDSPRTRRRSSSFSITQEDALSRKI